jgi:hypothetical protein
VAAAAAAVAAAVRAQGTLQRWGGRLAALPRQSRPAVQASALPRQRLRLPLRM